MEKRFYFDSEGNQFSSIKVGEFFTDSDPIKGEAKIFMRIEPVFQEKCLLCNAVNLETGEIYFWFDDSKVYPVRSAQIEIKM